MSNAAIIVLADAEAVPVRTLADRLRMHPVDVVKDLRGRGHRLGSIRGERAIGRWRSSEMTPNAISPNAVRPARHDQHAGPAGPHPRRRPLCRGTPPGRGMPSASSERCSNSSGAEKQVQPRLDEVMGRRIGGSPKAQAQFLDRIEGVRSPAVSEVTASPGKRSRFFVL